MASITLLDSPGPLPTAGREPSATARTGRMAAGCGLVGAVLRAALCVSSAADLDECGVLRTAVAQARPRHPH